MYSVYSRLKDAQEAIEQASEYIGELEARADALDAELTQAYRRLEELEKEKFARGQA